MTKFMYLFRGGREKMAAMSAEESQKHMQVWGAWMKSLAAKGTLVDGLPLAKDGKQVKNGGKIITDGPFAEGAEVVGGYLIVNAKNIEEAVEVSKGCPIFETGGEIEVREILNMDM
jgi:hypothetical protein